MSQVAPRLSRFYARRAMQIEVNGEAREIGEGSTVATLLGELGLGQELVAVERNEEVVPRTQHASAALRAGDRIEIVQFVGGG